MKTIVIGAGFSGLACAYELMTSGHDVEVLEARNRVGGRVYSKDDFIFGMNVEFGGELIGSNHHCLIEYAHEFGLEFLDAEDSEAETPIILQQQKLSQLEYSNIKAEIFKMQIALSEMAADIDADQPWLSPRAEYLDQMSMREWIYTQDSSAIAKYLFDIQVSSDNGVTTDKQSLLGNLVLVRGGGFDKFWSDTESYRTKGGNQQFATKFAQKLGTRLILNCPVTHIITEPSVAVVDVHGLTHEADIVVLAIPPSLWSTIRFTPELPEGFAPQMGMNIKHISAVESKYWINKNVSQNAKGDRKINETWNGTEGQDQTDYSAIVIFSGGNSAKSVNAEKELLDELEEFYPNIKQSIVRSELVNWITDRWTKGGYCFPAPGEITKLGPILRQGIGNLHFAGEHTCYKFIGYMEGAVASGSDLAARIIKELK
jgi:monoamine oxidase